MNVHGQLARVLCRIAAATSTIRTRADDAARIERNGGSTADLHARLTATIRRLEKVAAELEDALA